MTCSAFSQSSPLAPSFPSRSSCTSTSSSQYSTQSFLCSSRSINVILLFLDKYSPGRSPISSEHMGSGICDNNLLLYHPSLSVVLRIPCKPHRAHVLYDPVPVCHIAQHLVLHLLQLPHNLCAPD